jgi:hypothetical protein
MRHYELTCGHDAINVFVCFLVLQASFTKRMDAEFMQ